MIVKKVVACSNCGSLELQLCDQLEENGLISEAIFICSNCKKETRLPVPMSQDAKYLYKRLKLDYSQIRFKVSKIHFSILIWGPGKGNPLYTKRLLVLKGLREAGHAAFLSEEKGIEIQEVKSISASLMEAIQAKPCDLVVAIPESPGSIAETLTKYENVTKKMLIFYNRAHEDGYILKGPYKDMERRVIGERPLLMRGYDPEDLATCDLVKQIINEIEILQLYKYAIMGE